MGRSAVPESAGLKITGSLRVYVPPRISTVTLAFRSPSALSRRTASRARASVANGLSRVPALSSLPLVATKKSAFAGGSAAGSGDPAPRNSERMVRMAGRE